MAERGEGEKVDLFINNPSVSEHLAKMTLNLFTLVEHIIDLFPSEFQEH